MEILFPASMLIIGLITGLAPAETVSLDFHQDRFLLWRDGTVTWI